jgi:hypothetical protein
MCRQGWQQECVPLLLGRARGGAALRAGAGRLLTEDLQHGQRIDGLAVENPFLEVAG